LKQCSLTLCKTSSFFLSFIFFLLYFLHSFYFFLFLSFPFHFFFCCTTLLFSLLMGLKILRNTLFCLPSGILAFASTALLAMVAFAVKFGQKVCQMFQAASCLLPRMPIFPEPNISALKLNQQKPYPPQKSSLCYGTTCQVFGFHARVFINLFMR
jgi:hypothetical protein